jgi:hypothetical protein
MITQKGTIKIFLVINAVMLILQLLVLVKIIPYHVFWVGKINPEEQLVPFMSISILMDVILIGMLLIKLKDTQHNIVKNIVNGIIWIFALIFAINTIKNLFSDDLIVLVLGTALSFISSFLCWRIVKK